ncbi:MAG: acetyl-CoA carboxylase biotin carboxyl carrier protein subunit [Cytophagales bacterium]|nr:acetyl-CoA carboxylase biotin carboxyl carrier protein subunit [Cytophagales bacterium]
MAILNQTNSTPAIFDTMYKAQINERSYEFTAEDDALLVNGDPLTWDLTALDNGQYHIRFNNKSFPAEVVNIDRTTKTVDIKVRGRKYSIQLRDKIDLLMEKMGMNAGAMGKVNVIKAPMPGLIIDLRVSAGDEVQSGDSLLILEAMKMENIIKAPGGGTVKAVKVKKGDSVEKGQVLIEF